MQTETRSTKKDEATTLRRDRPRQFDAGIRIQGETSGGQPFGSWSQAYQEQAYQEPGYQGFMGSHQQGGYWSAEHQAPFSPGFSQGFAPAYANPMSALAPTLSYGLAGLADLVYRGVALATSQGQALINSVRPMQGNVPAGRPQPVAWPSARLPATDIVDEGAELVCQVELPGVKAENVEVSCFGRGLLVTAHSEPEIDLGALVQAERGLQTTYRRAINLPVPVQPSGVKATLRDGILTVNLPKANPTEAPRRIQVTSAN